MSEERGPAARAGEEDRAEQDLGREAVVVVAGLVRALSFYDINNVAVQRLIDQLLALHQRTGGGELRIQLLTDEFFVNGRLLRADEMLYERASVLSAVLSKLGVGDLTFGDGLDRAHVEALCQRVAAAVRSKSAKLDMEPAGAISLGPSRGSGIAAYRFEPDRLAVSVYAGLLDLVERLYAEHEAGNAPSLLPVKRSLQLLSDGMGTSPALYLLLAAVHDPAIPLNHARGRVAAATYAVGFARALGLGRDMIMTLALSAILGGLAEKGDADGAVEPLFRYAGLGDSAMPLALTLYDARALRQGRPAGVPGQLVALTHAYVARTAAARPATAPARFVRALAAGEFKGVDLRLCQVFAAWLGPCPIGSLVRLADGAVAVVVGQGDGPSRAARPTVYRIGPAGPELQIDLNKAGAPAIVGAPSYEEAGINLTAW